MGAYPTVARSALFVVFFWFGFIKLLGANEAASLALALTTKTVGAAHFRALFDGMAVFECLIGVLCLIPRLVRLLVVLLFVHLAVVCAPLVIVPERTWQTVMVPTMDGQYIIKNVHRCRSTRAGGSGSAAWHHWSSTPCHLA